MATKGESDGGIGPISGTTIHLLTVAAVYAASYYAYLAGPLAVAQWMKGQEMGEYLIVFACFGPIVLIAWGVLAVRQDIHDPAGRAGVIAGAVGAAVLLAMGVFGLGTAPTGVAAATAMRGPALALNFGVPVIYAALAYRFFSGAK